MKLKHIVKAVVLGDIELQAGDFTIGRNEGNNLQLNEGVVSGTHAVLTLTPNEYLPEMLDVSIKDLNSTNGTYVNSEKVTAVKLKAGDVIRIGNSEFKLFDENSDSGTQTEYHVPDDE